MIDYRPNIVLAHENRANVSLYREQLNSATLNLEDFFFLVRKAGEHRIFQEYETMTLFAFSLNFSAGKYYFW